MDKNPNLINQKNHLHSIKGNLKNEFEIAGQKYIEVSYLNEGGFGKTFKVKKMEESKIITEEEKMKLFFKKYLLGEDETEEEYFVIKKSKNCKFNETSKLLLIQEGEILKKLHHPNIINVIKIRFLKIKFNMMKAEINIVYKY